MNLFRSEEHIKNWSRYEPGTEEGILTLGELVKMFSGPLFRNRLAQDYVSHLEEYERSFLPAISEIAKKCPFWGTGQEAKEKAKRPVSV
jgi:hypothetical protein